MKISSFASLLLALLFLSSCSGVSKEYTADATKMLEQFDAAVAELESGVNDKAKRGDIALHFVDETALGTDGISAKVGDFRRKWDAKNEGELQSFKLIAEDAYKAFNAARRDVSLNYERATLGHPNDLEGAFTGSYLECKAATDKARRFLEEGK